MKVLAIVGSAKRNGNISNICNKIIAGAAASGHEVELINLYDCIIKHCIGCLECTKTRKCVFQDDFMTIYNKEVAADVVILAAPIYFHSVPGIMKDYIDRHFYAVMPYFEGNPQEKLINKLLKVKTYINQFKNNAPFKQKKFITVFASSNPDERSIDIRGNNTLMKKFIVDGMDAKIIKRIVCTDTLFRFNPKKIEKIYQKAYQTGLKL